MRGVKDVQSKEELDAALAGNSPASASSVVVVHFWASWCEASKQMDQVFSHLSTDFPHALFLNVEAEEQPEISDAYAVSAVPYFVFCKVTLVLCSLLAIFAGLEDGRERARLAFPPGSIEHGGSAAS